MPRGERTRRSSLGACTFLPQEAQFWPTAGLEGLCYGLQPPTSTGKAASSTCAMARPAAAMSTTLRLTTPHQACLECGSSLRRERDIEARLYHLEGVRPIYHTTKKCANGNCSAMHHYNYRWLDGKKMHTASIDTLDYIFVNPKVAFARSFLNYHGALQFGGCLSIHAIAFALKNVLLQDSNEHARWRLEHSTAQLHLNVLQVADTIWNSMPRMQKQQKKSSRRHRGPPCRRLRGKLSDVVPNARLDTPGTAEHARDRRKCQAGAPRHLSLMVEDLGKMVRARNEPMDGLWLSIRGQVSLSGSLRRLTPSSAMWLR